MNRVFDQPGKAMSWLGEVCENITINDENEYTTTYDLYDKKIVFTQNSLNDNQCIKVYSNDTYQLTIGYNDRQGSSISIYDEESHDINIFDNCIEYLSLDAFNYGYKEYINDNWSFVAISHNTFTEYIVLYKERYTGYHFIDDREYNKNNIGMVKPDNDHLKINDDVILIGESDGMQLFITMRSDNKISIVSIPLETM